MVPTLTPTSDQARRQALAASSQPSTIVISVDPAGAPGNGISDLASVSADGRYVAFESTAPLLPGDTNATTDVYVRDTLTNTTTLVTRGNCPCGGSSPYISPDGRYVAFISGDSGLVPGDTNGVVDVFVLDRSSGTYTRASVDSVGNQANGASSGGIPSLSDNGRWVVFLSSASNLVPNDTNAQPDIFVHDMVTGATTRVNVDSTGAQANSYSSMNGMPERAISADGRYVVFQSNASNLVAGDTNGSIDVFMHDMTTGATVKIDQTPLPGALGTDTAAEVPSITPDGRYVSFTALPWGDDYVYDTVTRTSTQVSVNQAGSAIGGDLASMSGNDRYAAFTGPVGGTCNGIYVRDLQAATTSIVSLNSSGNPVNCEYARYPFVPSDGRYVVWEGKTYDGVVGWQVFLRYIPNPAVALAQQLGSCDAVHAVDPGACQAEPVNTSIGNYYSQVTDVRLPGIGIPFAFTRSYNSADPTVGVLGRGWTFSYNATLQIAWNGDVTLRAEDGQKAHFVLQPGGAFLGDPGVRDALVKQADGTYTLTRHDQVVYRFDPTGKLISLRDRNNQGLSFSYTGVNLTQVTDSVGRAIALSYTGGLLTRLTLPDGRFVSYGYTAGQLTSVSDLRGYSTTYAYNSSNLLSSVTDQNNHTVVANTYDANGRVTQQTDGRVNTSTFAFDPQTQVATFTDARGKVWKDFYSNGVLVKQVDPLGDAVRFGYDLDLNRTSVTDARGNTTTYAYDSSGNLLTKTDPAPLNYQTVYTYTARNDIRTVTDPRGNVTTYGYDAAGNLTSITQPGSVITTLGRDPAGTGLLVGTTDPNNHTTTFGYDIQGNLTSITDPLGDKTTMGYDTSGRMTSRVDPRGNVMGGNPSQYTWTFTYDAADHLLTQTDPLGNTTTFTYDPVGNLLTRRDANNHTTTYTYDQDNNLKTVTAPDNALTTYAYDLSNNLAGRTDANNHTTTYAYDDANRLSSVTSPISQVWSFGYDPNGNLATKALPSGSVTYGYDVDNRLSSITYSNAPTTPNVTFGYDQDGNRTSMTDGSGSASYTYDALNRLSLATRGADTFSYGYDPASNLTSRTYPDTTVTTYTYDAANRLATTAVGSSTMTYGYDAASNHTAVTYPSSSGLTSALSYDRAGRLASVTNKKGNTVRSSFAYTLDAVGNPTQVLTDSETIAYTYDVADRLTLACYTPTCSGQALSGIGYAYDGVGNRLSETVYGVSGSTTTTYIYNAADQLTKKGTANYTYDPNGNQTKKGSRTFTYDLENRLLSATSGTTTESYAYDGDGNRLSLSTNGTVGTRYLWDPNASVSQLAIERDGTGALLRRYAYPLGIGRSPLSMTTGGSDHYYLADGLGSVANLTSSAGAKEWTYTYEPFGDTRKANMNSSSAPTNLVRFTGQLIDATTNDYDLRAREYDPSLGRFLQLDPLSGSISDPYVSSYVYARNRPTVAIDPSGLWCLVHNSSGGCLGGNIVRAVGDFVSRHRWEIATFLASAGCLAVPEGCAAIVLTYLTGQTAVIFENYDEELSVPMLVNVACNALKTLAFPTEWGAILSPLKAYSEPGCAIRLPVAAALGAASK